MEIGVSTASLFNRANNEDAVVILEGIDSRVTEIFLESFCEYTTEYANLLKSRIDKLKVHSIHTLNTHFEPQLFSINDRARGDGLKIFEDTLKCAQIVGAKNYTMHGLIHIKKGSVFSDYKRYGECFITLTNLCENYGVELCLENVEWAMYSKVGFFREVKQYCPKLKSCFDIKQARISGCENLDYIKEMGESLNTVHLSDINERGRICLPGKGVSDFKTLFMQLNDVGFKGNMLIEVYKESFNDYAELTESLEYLRKIKCEVFGNG